MKVIEGPEGFTSGKVVLNNSFLYTFEQEGRYCVVSDGAKQTYCIIQVSRLITKAATPELVNSEPYVLYQDHKIFLHSQTPNVVIHIRLTKYEFISSTLMMRAL